MDAAAAALDVPESDREAFKELYEALSEARDGREPPERELAKWRTTLQKARAVATVHQYLAEKEDQVKALCDKLEVAGSPESKVRRMVEQRLVFIGVYGKGLDGQLFTLDQAFERLQSELKEADEALLIANSGFIVRPGRFDSRHEALRRVAYPYQPACSASNGSIVIECVSAADEKLLAGYIAMQGDYADDLSVHPRFHGRGVAKALLCAAATQLVKQRQNEITLDARACNLPAFGMYTHLGFKVDRRFFPSFFDWHGGYAMSADSRQVASHMPKVGFQLQV